MPLKLLILSIVLGCFTACKQAGSTASAGENTQQSSQSTLKYAKRFGIHYDKEDTVVYLFGNRNNLDTTAAFVLHAKSFQVIKKRYPEYHLQSPSLRIAALSSIYANMVVELDALSSLVAIDNVDYICNPNIINLVKENKVSEVAKGPVADLEKIIALKPSLLFTFGMGNPDEDQYPKLMSAGIPVAVSVDHLEEHPLARAEWIKFFGIFLNKSARADSIFSEVERNYVQLRDRTERVKEKPTVFTEALYSDIWYMPGGKSYVACLLKDAGARYLWSDNENTGSLSLSFEQVVSKAANADYWLNMSSFKNKQELIGSESRYAVFKAFKQGHLYNNNKVVNAGGYSTYWESGMIHPDRILHDLNQILHPSSDKNLEDSLYYYKALP